MLLLFYLFVTLFVMLLIIKVNNNINLFNYFHHTLLTYDCVYKRILLEIIKSDDY